MLHDDVLIRNIKYGYVIMQNNGAMKIVNSNHAQTDECWVRGYDAFVLDRVGTETIS